MQSTVLLQSSSTTVSIAVSLVGTGKIASQQAIYMIMGANIGTSVTSTLVALGKRGGDRDKLIRVFAGATIHDLFNFLTVLVLLPVEAATGFLHYLTKVLVWDNSVIRVANWGGPVKRFVAPLAAKIIIANKDVTNGVAQGGKFESFYPIVCQDPSNPKKSTCAVGLIDCDHETNSCPFFFRPAATPQDDEFAAILCFFLSVMLILGCAIHLVTILRAVPVRPLVRIVRKACNVNDYVAMAVGAVITMLVQSSSITTAILTHYVGLNAITLQQMLPLTIGANLGTAVTAFLVAGSLPSNRVESLRVALAYLLFNIAGILLCYPMPFLRRIPLGLATRLGRKAYAWRGFPAVYVIAVFFLTPLILLGWAAVMSHHGSKAFDGLGLVLWLSWWAVLYRFVCGFKKTSDSLRGPATTRYRNGMDEESSFLTTHINDPSADTPGRLT